MAALKTLQDGGQSIWLDIISRELLESGAVEGCLDTDTAEVEAVGKAGIDVDALAAKLQADGRDSFVQSWNALLACIESKRKIMRAA